MSERRGPKALELWCRRITDGYPGVNVQNMTTSWRDGLAFCAMIHHFRPDLIDFNSLNKDNVYGNNELAFRIAEQHLGIPALLDAEDMASCSVPDRLSILTYLSQFYQHFGGSSPSRLALSRSQENPSQGMTPVSETPQPKVMPRRLEMRRDPCNVCNLPVFLAEKLVISRRTYHRTCFRCARCTNLLTPGNYYETEDGDYCCETCPDEDKSISIQSSPSTTPFSTPSKPSTPQPTPRSLSDEEKTKKLLETSKTAKMRLNFMSDHLESSSIDTTRINQFQEVSISSPNLQTSPPSSERVEQQTEDNLTPDLHVIKKLTDDLSEDSCLSGNNDSVVCQDTKETLGVVDNDDEDSQCLSLVQSRLKIFENTKNDKNLNKKTEIITDEHDFGDVPTSRCEEPDSLGTLDASEDAENPENIDEPQESSRQPPEGDIGVLEAEGIDLSNQEYPEDMNPFKSDDEDEVEVNEQPQEVKKVSTNPFGSSEDEEEVEEEKIPTPAARKRLGGSEPVKRVLQAPQINLNPFWSDDEEGESDEETTSSTPVPKPRTIKQTPDTGLKNLERSGFYASSSSLASSSSTTTTPGGTYRKRKPAPPPPPPPVANERVSTGLADVKSPQASHDSPIRTTPRPRKSKPAPPPPLPISLLTSLTLESSPISWEDEKISKNQSNKSKQSRSPEENDFPYQDKSTQGKWKRKKGPAPARPIPQRRKIKVMSMKDVKMELDEIEVQQQGLEKQGVRLEQLIRDRCENPDRNDGDRDENMTMDAEELVLELFALVNEKNELFRRQAELMLLKRQQRLEEEHADIEYQIRCLMCQPEATKTDFDKQREEALIQRLVEIVERRSEIVECLEMDRKREVEEDKSINHHMGLFAAKSKADLTRDQEESPQKPHKSKKLKIKGISLDKHLKKIHKKDADKDVDETEVKLKRQNKKKWF